MENKSSIFPHPYIYTLIFLLFMNVIIRNGPNKYYLIIITIQITILNKLYNNTIKNQ